MGKKIIGYEIKQIKLTDNAEYIAGVENKPELESDEIVKLSSGVWMKVHHGEYGSSLDRSFDEGQTWNTVDSGFYSFFDIVELKNKVVLITGGYYGEGLYISFNGGYTFLCNNMIYSEDSESGVIPVETGGDEYWYDCSKAIYKVNDYVAAFKGHGDGVYYTFNSGEPIYEEMAYLDKIGLAKVAEKVNAKVGTFSDPSQSAKVGVFSIFSGDSGFEKGRTYERKKFWDAWDCWKLPLSQLDPSSTESYYFYSVPNKPIEDVGDLYVDGYSPMQPTEDPSHLAPLTPEQWPFEIDSVDNEKIVFKNEEYPVYPSELTAWRAAAEDILKKGDWVDVTPNNPDLSYNPVSEAPQSGKAVAEAMVSIFDRKSGTVMSPLPPLVTISTSSDLSNLCQDDKIVLSSGSVVNVATVTNLDNAFLNSTAVSSGNITFEGAALRTEPLTMNWTYARSDIRNIEQAPIFSGVTSLVETYSGCGNFNSPVTIPDTVENVDYIFNRCYNFNSPITIPDSIVNRVGMFFWCHNFNQPVGNLNMIVNGSKMFHSCMYHFNQDVGELSNLVDGAGMFYGCHHFNGHVGNLNNLANGRNMFGLCYNFNLPVGNLDNLIDGSEMFFLCNNFGQDVGLLENLVYGNGMFENCSNYSSPLNLSNLKFGSSMFSNVNINFPVGTLNNLAVGEEMFHNSNFNQTLNLSNLYQGTGMFSFCHEFNSPIGNLDNLVSGCQMFYECESFDQPIGTLPKLYGNCSYMFANCRNFNQPLGVIGSTSGYFKLTNFLENCQSYNQDMYFGKFAARLDGMFSGCPLMEQRNIHIPSTIAIGDTSDPLYNQLVNGDAGIDFTGRIFNDVEL